MSKQFVRCCDTTTMTNRIYIKENEVYFRLVDLASYNNIIEYCPWCGVLLDLNLEMTPTDSEKS